MSIVGNSVFSQMDLCEMRVKECWISQTNEKILNLILAEWKDYISSINNEKVNNI